MTWSIGFDTGSERVYGGTACTPTAGRRHRRVRTPGGRRNVHRIASICWRACSIRPAAPPPALTWRSTTTGTIRSAVGHRAVHQDGFGQPGHLYFEPRSSPHEYVTTGTSAAPPPTRVSRCSAVKVHDDNVPVSQVSVRRPRTRRRPGWHLRMARHPEQPVAAGDSWSTTTGRPGAASSASPAPTRRNRPAAADRRPHRGYAAGQLVQRVRRGCSSQWFYNTCRSIPWSPCARPPAARPPALVRGH